MDSNTHRKIAVYLASTMETQGAGKTVLLACFLKLLRGWEPTPIEELAAISLLRHLGHFDFFPQFHVLSYRVDFRITRKGKTTDDDLKIIIECDGHDFHERTKDQASKDKERDRELQKAGYRVLRFTGSDIWRNPDIVGNDVYDLAFPRKNDQ